MLGALKNVLLTAVMVIGATVATACAAALITLAVALQDATAEQANLAVYGGMAMVLLAAVAGLFFSVMSLVVAGLTMPPAIALMRMFKLPRPLFDILGGGVAGFLCAQAAISTLESFARAKGGNVGGDDMRLLLEISGLLSAALLGYLRHAALVRPGAASVAPDIVEAGAAV